jgi:hypothetical protein
MLTNLANALNKRGFLITLHDDHIYFGKGNHDDEIKYLETMFKRFNLLVRLDDRKIFLLDEGLDQNVLENIAWYKAVNHEAGGGSGWASWRYFITRNHGPKVNTFVLETGVALLVKAISSAGITPICSCDGHGQRAPFIAFAGKQNAVWFNILLDEVKDQMKLNYEWYFQDTDQRDISFAAKKRTEGWNLKLILEDTQLMAEYLLENSDRFSKLKKEIFGGQYKSTRKIVHAMNYEEMSVWMRHKYETRNKLIEIQ